MALAPSIFISATSSDLHPTRDVVAKLLTLMGYIYVVIPAPAVVRPLPSPGWRGLRRDVPGNKNGVYAKEFSYDH